jgi:AcrR family transcriptional regulator
MSHLERRQKDKEEIKQRILEAARKIAANEGWHALTIRKIADEIEYTPPIVYEHFENKEDLIHEIIDAGFSKLGKEFSVARQSETDSRKLLILMSLIHWDFAFNNVELYQLMFSLERPAHNEEMLAIGRLIEGTFLDLTNNNKELIHELIFNWMCLMQGAISIVMKNPSLPHQKGKNPRDLYMNMISRFIDSL